MANLEPPVNTPADQQLQTNLLHTRSLAHTQTRVRTLLSVTPQEERACLCLIIVAGST